MAKVVKVDDRFGRKAPERGQEADRVQRWNQASGPQSARASRTLLVSSTVNRFSSASRSSCIT